MADETGDTTPLDFDSPDLQWADEEPQSGSDAAAPPPATEDEASAAPEDAEKTPAPAITEPAPDESAAEGDRQPQGPIPFDRHEAILAREREKRTQLEAEVAWAKELQESGRTPEQVQQALNIVQGIDGDPVGFLEKYHERLQSHPELAGPLKSWAGKVLATRQASGPTVQATADGDGEPQPDFQNEAGVPFYSGPQLQKWQAWNTRQQQAQFQSMIAPLQQAHTQAQQRQAIAVLEQQQTAKAQAELDELRKVPSFKENEAKVHAVLKAANYQMPLVAAFNQVLVNEVLPSAGQAAKTAQLTELQQKAAANTVNPRTAAQPAPKSPTDFDDPSLEW